MNSKDKAAQILSKAEVVINGPQPIDLQVKDERVYDRVFSGGSLALGESYMDGWWDVEDLSGAISKILRSNIPDSLRNAGVIWHFVKSWVLNRQNQTRAFEVGEKHYDIGNDLYERMLGKRMVYTCGYWSSPTTPAQDLDDAQEQKLDLVCRKIGLKPGQVVLDVGCGWGSFAKFAAEKYGAKVVGITISKEQAALARERCKGLDVEIRVEDYRDTKGQFDHIISLGMFEHVGPKNYRTYMRKMNELLKDDGIFLLHTIGGNHSVMASDAWLDKYIFPNGVLPSVTQIGRAIERLFIMEDWHNFGPDYDKTLMAWWANFDKHWPEIKDSYSGRFYRMWKYYLMTCAAVFRARESQLWQIVLTKQGLVGGYRAVR
ncbi:MAG TPA: cyclopropane fatty acyl phospholipid synthase [Candidatus Paceibacterota bacterium]|jgi:cyclopropane-fatty-acyl-phospholipid synthase|nr:cyclopropane fatty acyl phospholipid synthase [Candidatus Paceibacterota bacterium]